MKFKKPIIFFDLETTGVSVTNDRIVQIATVKIDEHGNKETKEYLINPTVHIPKEASDIHGITDDMVKDKPTFDAYAKNLYNYFEGCDIGGYNSNSFDIPLLMAEFKRVGIVFDINTKSLVDVMLIERKANSLKLTEVYKRYTGKDFDNAHDATADVEATIVVLQNQIEKYKLVSDSEVLDIFTQGDSKRVDISGKLHIIDSNICWGFGKHKDKPINTDIGYARWFLGTDVPVDTELIIKKELNIK